MSTRRGEVELFQHAAAARKRAGSEATVSVIEKSAVGINPMQSLARDARESATR